MMSQKVSHAPIPQTPTQGVSPMKKFLCTLSLSIAMAALASAAPLTYSLSQDAGLGHTNPVGTWAFLSALHTPDGWNQGSWEQTPSSYSTAVLDWNAGDNREIWYRPGNQWYDHPAVYVSNYTNSATRAINLTISNGGDAIVKWTSPVTGTISLSGFLTDATPIETSQGALMWITKYTGSGLDTNLVQTVNVAAHGSTNFSFQTTVNAGDVLYFRKTFANSPDNYGKWISGFDVSIAVPEPACLGLLALGAVGLLRRRRE